LGLLDGELNPIIYIFEAVETDKTPTAPHQRTDIAADGGALADRFQHLSPVGDMARDAIFEMGFDIIGFIFPEFGREAFCDVFDVRQFVSSILRQVI
jgi:hypothetical protein